MQKPESVIDIVENINNYIEKTRGIKAEETMQITNYLEDYVQETIRGLNISQSELNKLISNITDTLYRKTMSFKKVDLYTNGFIAIVINRIFWELGQKNIRMFYILDNSLPDWCFKILLEQFPPAGFSVITPHIAKNLEYISVSTQTDNLSYEEVKDKINEALKYKKNIFYIERDASVNYLHNVVDLAKNSGEEYVKIMRNTTIDDLEIITIDSSFTLFYTDGNIQNFN